MIMNTEFLQESQVSDKRYDQWTGELLFIHIQCMDTSPCRKTIKLSKITSQDGDLYSK